MTKKVDYIIRDFEEKDFTALDILWQRTCIGGEERGDNLDIINNTFKKGGRLLIMEEKISGCLIGSSWITIDGRRSYLHHFGILPEYQKNGLGKELLKESLKIAKDIGLQIKLEVHKNNIAAIKLYEKYGFKYLGDYIVQIIRDIT
ncbi:GNAT family N-acetyltransferase [Bacteroidota bacterium]